MSDRAVQVLDRVGGAKRAVQRTADAEALERQGLLLLPVSRKRVILGMSAERWVAVTSPADG
jgi:hypothetical protein